MAGNQHFSPANIQFQLVYDRGQCAESSYLNPEITEVYFDIELRLIDWTQKV